MSIKIYNVLSHKKEVFVPIEPGNVKMYACGITVSDNAHIGHAYQSVVFDMIVKYFKYRGMPVKYVRNYTDVDDKIIARARDLGEDPIEYAQRFIKKTDAEMDALGNTRPIQPRVSESINQIINFVARLIENKNAYTSEFGDVYFDVSSFPEYGKLSRVKPAENEAGVRKELEPGKKNSADFALWKSAKPGEISWQSPWGAGRPGWHIECSAMNLENLGEEIDIHGGGRDLIFPHHENEIAQTESLTGKKFANFWIHCGLIKINGQKMSKSLGNGILIGDIISQYDADTIRFALLRNAYSSDIDISDDFFPNAQVAIYNIYSVLANIMPAQDLGDPAKTDKIISDMIAEFESAMDDNFNTSLAFSIILKYIKIIAFEKNKNTEYDLQKIANAIVKICEVFNILQKNPSDYINSVRVEILKKSNITRDDILEKIIAREKFKSYKDFASADSIRADLFDKKIILNDAPGGTTWDIIF